MYPSEQEMAPADNDVSENLPLTNLLDTFKILVTNSLELSTISAKILKSPKDEHGNVLIGIDNTNFTLWEKGIKKIVPTKYFGPIIIPTNPKVIKKLLSLTKSGAEAPFKGNRSTEVIDSFVGGDNPFAPTNKALHTHHKQLFKNHINDDEENIRKVGSIIANWIEKYSRADSVIDENTISSLCAEVLIAFLLSQTSVREEVKKAVITMKTYFSSKVTMDFFYIFNFIANNSAKKLLSQEISNLYLAEDEETYPVVLKKSGMSEKEVQSHILSLFMVGFGNLHSSVMSMLIRIADNPEYREELSQSIQSIADFPFVQFKPQLNTSSFSEKFFEEALRLTPPVMMIVRKNKKEEVVVSYKEEKKAKEMILPSSALVIIPNLHLAREINNGNEFYPNRPSEDFKNIPKAFSEGGNACPGRNIGYVTNGLIVGGVLSNNMTLDFLENPRHVTGTALSWKGKMIVNASNLSEKQSMSTSRPGFHFFKKEKINLALGMGTTASLMAFFVTHNLSVSIAMGLTTAFLAMALLAHLEPREKIQFESLNTQSLI